MSLCESFFMETDEILGKTQKQRIFQLVNINDILVYQLLFTQNINLAIP